MMNATLSSPAAQVSATAHPSTQQPAVIVDAHPASAPPIPSYEAATRTTPPALVPAITDDADLDELPDYTVVDSNQTTFMIYGTFIYTPNGPAYHLSSLLDACISKLRIRRLRAEDVALIESGHTRSVAFDDSTTLYEAHDPPFIDNEYFLYSKTRTGWPGTLQLRFGFQRWHIQQVARQGLLPKPLLTCGKMGALTKRILKRRNELEPSEWKDTQGRVVATEVLKLVGGKMLPTIQLSKDLDQQWRELMLALWVSRLWAGFGAGAGSW